MARILVVEDDEWSRRIVADLLQMRGHEVIEATDYASARAGLAQGPELVPRLPIAAVRGWKPKRTHSDATGAISRY